MKMKKLRCLFGAVVFFVTILVLYLSIECDPGSYEEYQVVLNRWRHSNHHYNGVKTILYWNKMFAEYRHFMFGSGDVFKDCSVPHCYASPNRKLLNSVRDYDAVLFHGIEMNLWDLPHTRSPHQKYIYCSLESPLSRPINTHEFALRPNFYNWTMTYRVNSDIIRPYSVIRDIATNKVVFPPKNENEIIQWRQPNETATYTPSTEELSIIKNKMKMAAWFVSHCDTLSYRDHLTKELQKHLMVDIYGACGDLDCEKNTQECYDLVERDYYYYLSFENTLCKDYITEKVYSPMQKYTIPIVYGGGNYSKFLPPHSYIDIYDYGTMKDLADYMINLANDPYKYASYFWWKKYYRIEDPTKFTLCNLCAMLHDTSLPKTSIEDFEKYYMTDECRTIDLNITITQDQLNYDTKVSLT